jgi:hypothetical protein
MELIMDQIRHLDPEKEMYLLTDGIKDLIRNIKYIYLRKTAGMQKTKSQRI